MESIGRKCFVVNYSKFFLNPHLRVTKNKIKIGQRDIINLSILTAKETKDKLKSSVQSLSRV